MTTQKLNNDIIYYILQFSDITVVKNLSSINKFMFHSTSNVCVREKIALDLLNYYQVDYLDPTNFIYLFRSNFNCVKGFNCYSISL